MQTKPSEGNQIRIPGPDHPITISPLTATRLSVMKAWTDLCKRFAVTLAAARVKRSLVFTAGLLPSEENADKRGRALLILSGLLGAINLSRAVSDPILSREILDLVRQQLVDLTAGNALSKRRAGLKVQTPLY
jgi:hypothetical protein